MTRYFISSVAIGVATAAVARAQQSTFPATPLASKHYAYPTEIVSKTNGYVYKF